MTPGGERQLSLWPARGADCAPEIEQELLDVLAPAPERGHRDPEEAYWARVAYEHQVGFNIPLPDAPFPGGDAAAILSRLTSDDPGEVLRGLAAVRARDDPALDAWLARGSVIWRGQYQGGRAVVNEVEAGAALASPGGAYVALALLARLGRLEILDALNVSEPLAHGSLEIACLPPEISHLRALERLTFDHTCSHIALPPQVGRLPSLTHLTFVRVAQARLPPSLLEAPRLREVVFHRSAPTPASEATLAALAARGVTVRRRSD